MITRRKFLRNAMIGIGLAVTPIPLKSVIKEGRYEKVLKEDLHGILKLEDIYESYKIIKKSARYPDVLYLPSSIINQLSNLDP